MNKSDRNNELLRKGLISNEATDYLQKRLRKKLKTEQKNQKKEIKAISKKIKSLQLSLN